MKICFNILLAHIKTPVLSFSILSTIIGLVTSFISSNANCKVFIAAYFHANKNTYFVKQTSYVVRRFVCFFTYESHINRCYYNNNVELCIAVDIKKIEQ